MPDVRVNSTTNVSLYDETGVEIGTERNNRFSSLIKFEPRPNEELRSEETLSDRYHGRAPDGTATSDASWEIVRFYKNPLTGQIVRTRYRENVSWDNRATGW